MSVISLGGRLYAANLHWLKRTGRRATARTARRLQRYWFVDHGQHAGFAGRDASGCPDGLPALSLALMSLIGGGRWVALVEGAPVGGGTLYALVKARDRAILADGEEIFRDRATALKALERSRSPGWALHATPGLSGALQGGESEIAELDINALGEVAQSAGDTIVLVRPAPVRDVDWRKLRVAAVAGLVAIGVQVLIATGYAWVERDALLAWIEESGETSMPWAPPFDLPASAADPPPMAPPSAHR